MNFTSFVLLYTIVIEIISQLSFHQQNVLIIDSLHSI